MVDDCFDIDNLRIDAQALPERRAVVPRKLEKRRRHFVKVPWAWVEALSGASGQTWHLAIQLLYLHWKGKGAAIKLANGMLKVDGISRSSKGGALRLGTPWIGYGQPPLPPLAARHAKPAAIMGKSLSQV
jgi:hypothetical protein